MEVIIDRELPRGSKLKFPERMSEEAFSDFCMQNPDLILERDQYGNILVEPPVYYGGSCHESAAHEQLFVWSHRNKTGKVFTSNAGYTLPNGAVRSPDASWISNERIVGLLEREHNKFAHICPDFVLEIRSGSDRLQELKNKMKEYMENGAQLGFLIDPIEQQAFIYRPDGTVEHFAGLDGELSGEPVLPGFSMPLSLFKAD